jgi:hypothetical protein
VGLRAEGGPVVKGEAAALHLACFVHAARAPAWPTVHKSTGFCCPPLEEKNCVPLYQH